MIQQLEYKPAYNHLKRNENFVNNFIERELKRRHIPFRVTFSKTGTCYVEANNVKVRISEHEIDHVNYDLQVLYPGKLDARTILHYILREDRRVAIIDKQ